MIFDSDGTTTIVSQENVSLGDFIGNFKDGYPKIGHGHVIVDLLSFEGLSADDLSLFLELSNDHRNKKKSFVLVTDKVSYDEAPEEICVVPTLQEARDIIEMEDMERDLGL